MSAGDRMPRDSVDALLASWAARRPDLDFRPVGVVTRLARVRRHIEAEMERVFAAHDLDPPTFGVLATLARLDDGRGTPQQQLVDALGSTSAAIEERTNRLIADGLVERHPDTQAGGEALVSLSEYGRDLVARIVPAHLANERRLLSGLTDEDLDTLAALLRKLLLEYEGTRPAKPDGARLGLTVAPAHQTADLRRAVGLPPATGLLVRHVQPQSVAVRAGLRTGDLLLRGDDHDLRSISAFYGAIADAAATTGRLRLIVLRGEHEREATLALGEAWAIDGSGAASPGRAAFPEHVI